MAQKKEDLEKLLILLDNLSNEKGNEWFKEALFKKYNHSSNTVSNSIETKIDFIQNYLKIDGLKCIDYSQIPDKKVQDQLSVDCIMMARFRLGKIDNKVNFEEFCRYAHYQAEELINYFLRIRHKNQLKEVIKEVKAKMKVPKEFTAYNVGDIPYKFKLQCCSEILSIAPQTKSLLFVLTDLRNLMSHRDALSEKREAEIYKQYEAKGLNKKFVPFDRLTDEEIELNKIGKVIVFIKNQDFDIVWNSIEDLKQLVELNMPLTLNGDKKAIFKNNSTFGDLPSFKNLKN